MIYADPPWTYRKGTAVEPKQDPGNNYPVLTVDQLYALPVKSVCALKAVLFLWTTAPLIAEGLKVMSGWGFEYKSQAVWNKDRLGMGYWWRGQHEILLVGTMGNHPCPKPSARFGSVFTERSTKHSKKPLIIRDAIEKMFPEAHRLELFARDIHPGWISWGNEVDVFADDLI